VGPQKSPTNESLLGVFFVGSTGREVYAERSRSKSWWAHKNPQQTKVCLGFFL